VEFGRQSVDYCVITNFLNPLLEEVALWSRLEAAIERLAGVKRRNEAGELALLELPPRKAAPTTCAICTLQPC
jgi:hypothetical protein